MSVLRVGMRVRIKWSRAWPELAGQEGQIVARNTTPFAVPGSRIGDWRVAPDAWGSDIAPRLGANGGNRFAPVSDQLEPILPDSYTKITWAECIWQPEREAA